MGISFPLSGSYVGEVTPTAQRAKLLIYARYYFSFGMISTCLIGWYLLQYNAWRLLLFIICLPGIYAYW